MFWGASLSAYRACWVSAGEVGVDICAGLRSWLFRVWGVFNSCSGGFSAGLIPHLYWGWDQNPMSIP